MSSKIFMVFFNQLVSLRYIFNQINMSKKNISNTTAERYILQKKSFYLEPNERNQ